MSIVRVDMFVLPVMTKSLAEGAYRASILGYTDHLYNWGKGL